MGFLSKRAPDIDYTLLAKRGIIKKPKEIKDMIDFTAPAAGQQEASGQANADVQTQSNAQNPFSFLDAPAGSSAAPMTNFFDNASSNSANSDSAKTSEKLAEIENLKVKIEDLEFKLERLNEKFAKIADKLIDFEKKVG